MCDGRWARGRSCACGGGGFSQARAIRLMVSGLLYVCCWGGRDKRGDRCDTFLDTLLIGSQSRRRRKLRAAQADRRTDWEPRSRGVATTEGHHTRSLVHHHSFLPARTDRATFCSGNLSGRLKLADVTRRLALAS